MAYPSHLGFVLAICNIPTTSDRPTTKINGVSFTSAKNVFAIPGITNFNACGRITKTVSYTHLTLPTSDLV